MKLPLQHWTLRVALALLPAVILWLWLRRVPALRIATELPSRQVRFDAGSLPAKTQRNDDESVHLPAPAQDGSPWSAAALANPRELVRRLRRLGCPEETIRDLITLRLTRAANENLQAHIRAEESSRPWWRDRNDSVRRVLFEARQLRDQTQRQIETTLGVPFAEVFAGMFPAHASTPPPQWLDPTRREALSEAKQELEAQLEQIRAKAGSAAWLDDTLRAEMRQARQEHRAKLEELLGPKDFAEYLARESSAAAFVRQHLPAPSSEVEFRTMVEAADQTGIDFDGLQAPSPADLEGWKQAQKDAQRRVRERFQSLLDPGRAADFSQQEAEREAQELAAENARRQHQEQANEAALQNQLIEAARVAGADEQHATGFLEALRTKRGEWQTLEKQRRAEGITQKEIEQQFRAAMEALAREHFGAAGGEVLRQLPGWKAE